MQINYASIEFCSSNREVTSWNIEEDTARKLGASEKIVFGVSRRTIAPPFLKLCRRLCSWVICCSLQLLLESINRLLCKFSSSSLCEQGLAMFHVLSVLVNNDSCFVDSEWLDDAWSNGWWSDNCWYKSSTFSVTSCIRCCCRYYLALFWVHLARQKGRENQNYTTEMQENES